MPKTGDRCKVTNELLIQYGDFRMTRNAEGGYDCQWRDQKYTNSPPVSVVVEVRNGYPPKLTLVGKVR